MPDYVDTMMYVGEMPWHKQGVMVKDAPTIKDAIELAGLNWEVKNATRSCRTEMLLNHLNLCLTWDSVLKLLEQFKKVERSGFLLKHRISTP